jgi:hypothetical protein
MKAYTVRQLADMAGVTVRTLHHYDAVGLLSPSTRTSAGYRLYREEDLLRLQQILFFREARFPAGADRGDPGRPRLRSSAGAGGPSPAVE